MPYHPRHLHFCINQNQTMLIQVNKRYFHSARFSRFLRQEVFNNISIKVAWIRRSVGRGWPVNLARTRRKMTTANSFSPQNDVGSRVSTTQYWGNLIIVVVVVSESKLSNKAFAWKWRSPIGSFNPVIPTQIFPQFRNPDGYFWHFTSRVFLQSPISPPFCLKIPNPEVQIPYPKKSSKNGENFWAKIVYMSNMREKHRRFF